MAGMTKQRVCAADLLPVLGHDLVAGVADARAISLQALQHDRIPIIHDSAAKARDIPGAGIMALLLRNSAGRKEHERKDKE